MLQDRQWVVDDSVVLSAPRLHSYHDLRMDDDSVDHSLFPLMVVPRAPTAGAARISLSLTRRLPVVVVVVAPPVEPSPFLVLNRRLAVPLESRLLQGRTALRTTRMVR